MEPAWLHHGYWPDKVTFINVTGILIMIQDSLLFVPIKSLSLGHNLEPCILTKILALLKIQESYNPNKWEDYRIYSHQTWQTKN